jgi:MFS transporter, putative metabolite:H+ symporter
MQTVNAGARLDRLPVSRFHYRMLGLIAGGMFLDAFEIYLQGAVIAALLASGWSTPAQNANFISATFAGMVIGAWFAGVAGDRYGRRFSYQINLLIFGVASLAGAVAPSMSWLIAARFIMGIGLGAEIVVGYVSVMEIVPPESRGRWGAGLAALTNTALFASALVARLVIPNFGWRWMFVIVGIGALWVWYLRKSMPESPRWLEAQGRLDEAETVLRGIEGEVERSTGSSLAEPAPVAVLSIPSSSVSAWTLFSGELLARTITGSIILIALNSAIYGFIAFLPSFMVSQGLTVTKSLNYVTLMSLGGPAGALVGVAVADRLGRKPCILLFSLLAIACGMAYPMLADPALVTVDGFILVASIYVLVAVAWSMYVPETFPTAIRMRGAGFCNSVGRFVTIVTPQIAVLLYGSGGVMAVVGYTSFLLLLQMLCVALLGQETKQMSLETLASLPREGTATTAALAMEREQA